jgi:hypothetical protein
MSTKIQEEKGPNGQIGSLQRAIKQKLSENPYIAVRLYEIICKLGIKFLTVVNLPWWSITMAKKHRKRSIEWVI